MGKMMKLSPTKILMTCGLGLMITLGGFGHYLMNQSHYSTINVLNQGLGTCFGRINQSFTAMMIKDVKSPYLDKGFTQLSNACIGDLKSTFGPLSSKLPNVGELINKLNSETTWFHEKLGSVHSPMLLGQEMDGNLNPIQERYTAIEKLRVGLADELDMAMFKIKNIQTADEVIIGTGLFIFLFALGILTLKEMKSIRLRNQVEKSSVDLLANNQAHIGAMVDLVVTKALVDQGLVVTAQIFKDYHEGILENIGQRHIVESDYSPKTSSLDYSQEGLHTEIEKEVEPESKTSLKEVISSLQMLNADVLCGDISDCDLKIELEECTQILSTAIHKLSDRKFEGTPILVESTGSGEKCEVVLTLAQSAFNAEELGGDKNPSYITDPYLRIIGEMALEFNVTWNYENVLDENHSMAMKMTFNFPREPKAKNLVSVVKGKKKDLFKNLNY